MTGCQHARSFLHMNSDSPSPFLGLELSVDATDSQIKARSELQTTAIVASEFEGERSIPTAMTSGQANVQIVSATADSQNSGNRKYSLPTVNLGDGSSDADEVDAIINRFPGT